MTEKKKIPWWGWGIIVFVVFWIIGNFISHDPTEFDAWVACESFVRSSLKAPASASFSGNNDTNRIVLGENRWAINGWVDAQNSFGAKMRSAYNCHVKFDTDREKWLLETISIN